MKPTTMMVTTPTIGHRITWTFSFLLVTGSGTTFSNPCYKKITLRFHTLLCKYTAYYIGADGIVAVKKGPNVSFFVVGDILEV